MSFTHDEQEAAVDTADLWTAKQAARFGVPCGEILGAVKRGWVARDIETLSAKNVRKLAGEPLPPGDIVAGIRKLRDAPVLPVRLSYHTKRRLRDVNR